MFKITKNNELRPRYEIEFNSKDKIILCQECLWDLEEYIDKTTYTSFNSVTLIK